MCSTPQTIQKRDPTDSELEFFKRTDVPGYAADDNKIVMNPAPLPRINKDAVVENEAMRIYIRKNQPELPELTKEQEDILNKTDYYKSADDYTRRSTIMGRVVSGDPTAGKPTKEQKDTAMKYRKLYAIE